MNKFQIFLLSFLGFVIGLLLGAGLLFSVLFLMKVIPHGGI